MDTLVRGGGVAAILAGVLRAAVSFAWGSEVERQVLYLIIDLLLLLGVFAAYAQNHEGLGRWGAAGLLTTVAGILLVRSNRTIPGLDLYPAGALSVSIGWVLLSLDWRRSGNGSSLVPVLFALSLVTGLVGQTVPGAASLFVASGVIFGVAMVGVGRCITLCARHPDRRTAESSRSLCQSCRDVSSRIHGRSRIWMTRDVHREPPIRGIFGRAGRLGECGSVCDCRSGSRKVESER
jgi:hypothetical protein